MARSRCRGLVVAGQKGKPTALAAVPRGYLPVYSARGGERQMLAHGASRGFSHAPSPLAPLPARRGEGCQGSSASRWRGVGPGFPGLAPWANRDFSPRSGKGGASAPPQQDIPSYPRVSRPEQLVRSSGSGRETKRELAAASSAGLKPRPSDRPMKATKCGEKSGLISYAPAGLIGRAGAGRSPHAPNGVMQVSSPAKGHGFIRAAAVPTPRPCSLSPGRGCPRLRIHGQFRRRIDRGYQLFTFESTM